MLEGNRLPAGIKVSPRWWKEWQATWLPNGLPSASECHHHAGPRSFATRQLFCQVCLLFLEDDEEDNRAFPLTPSILREFQGDGVNELETPRNSTYRHRLALARETFSTLVRELAEQGREWLAQEMLNDIEPLNDDDAVFRLWIFLGGPQGKIADQT